MVVYGIILFALLIGVRATGLNENVLFQEGKHFVYTYETIVNTGAEKPQNAHSQWKFTAFLNIKTEGKYVLYNLSNLKTAAYNGIVTSNSSYFLMNVTNLIKLTEPFKAEFENGLLKTIFLDPGEELWSLNIKRAIATLFQLDLQQLQSAAFFSDEKNIYGNCTVEYNVQNDSRNELLYIRKFINHNKCTERPFQVWSSAPRSACPTSHQNSVISSSERKLTIKLDHTGIILRYIYAHAGLFLQPYEANGDAHYTQTTQILKLQQILNLTDTTNVTHLRPTEITFEHDTYDFTSGRRKINKKEKIAAVINDIEQLMYNFEHNFSAKNPDLLHSRVLQMLYFQLRELDISALHQIYADIGLGTSYQQETKDNIFLELLPQIGSEASTEFIKELILSRNIKDITAVKLLSTLPFYIENSNDALLDSFEPLLSLGKEFSQNVRQTAVLSFATLVYKTFSAKKCSIQTFEKYARRYFDAFAVSLDYEERLLYLEGLNNLQLGSVRQFLTPVVANSNTYSHHIRFLAIWALMATTSTSPDEVYLTYWPIFQDKNEHLEMRIGAFMMLLLSEPNTGRLISLYWVMQTENNPHLINFYYTTLKSFQYTTYPCYSHIGTLAAQIIRFIKPPTSQKFWVTGNYLLDYRDADREFGSMMQLLLIGNQRNDRLNVFHLTINNYAMGRNMNQFSIYLKLQGVAETILDKLTVINGRDVKFEKLIKILQFAKLELQSPDPVHIEILTQIEGKTTFSRYINETTFNLFSKALLELQNLKSEYHINYQHVGIALASRELYPSDIGTTIWLGSLSGASASLRGNFTYTLENAAVMRKNDLDFRYSLQTQNSLLSYNPLLDTYHGIERQKVLHCIFPLITNISLDVFRWELIASMQQVAGPPPSVLFHTRSISFIRSKENEPELIGKLCQNCDSEYELKANDLLTNEDIFSTRSADMHRQLQISIFECDSPYSLKKIYNDINYSHRANFNVLRPTKYVLMLQHILDYISFIPSSGRCGMAFTIDSTSDEKPTIVWKLTFVKKFKTDANESSPEEIYQIHSNINHRLRGLDLNYSLDASSILEKYASSSIYKFKFKLERKVREEIEKLFLQATLRIPPWQSDMFSNQPVEPTTMSGQIEWGPTNNTATNFSENCSRIEWNAVLEITKEQINEAYTAQTWPFKQCKEQTGNLKFTPLSEECFRASLKVSTPRKYTIFLKMKKVPGWFSQAIQRLKYIFNLFSTTENVMDVKVPSVLNMTFEYSQKNETINIDINKKHIILEDISITDMSYLLPNVRFPINSELNVNLGLITSCIITPTYITNIYNMSLPNKVNSDEILVLADCSNYPKFALFVNKKINRQSLSFVLYTGGNTAAVTQLDKETVVKVNGEVVDAKNGYQYPIEDILYDFKIWHKQDDVIEIESKLSRVWVHYTKEYILITVPGFYKGQLCGECVHPSPYTAHNNFP